MSSLQWSTIELAIQAWITAGSGLPSSSVVWAQQNAPRPVAPFISMRLTVLEHQGRDWLDRADNIVIVPTQAITAVSTGADTLTIPLHGLLTGTGPLAFTNVGGGLPAPLAPLTEYWPVAVDANTIKVATTFQNAVAVVPIVVDLTTAGSGTSSISGAPTTTAAGAEILQRARGSRQAVLQLQCFAGATGSGTGTGSPMALLHDAITSYVLESRAAALAAAGIGVGRVDPTKSIDGIVNTTTFEPRAIAMVHLHLASELVETSTFIQVVNATNSIPTVPVALPPIVLPV